MNRIPSTPSLPPPPPSPPSPSYTQHRPRPVQPPPLTTAFGPQHRAVLAAQTPASAIHAASPFSPSLQSSGLPTLSSPAVQRISPSTMNTYNPQDWGRAATVTGQYMPHSAATAQARARGTRESTGMEASLPSPPPPYSASASPNVASPRTMQASPQSGQFVQPLATSPNSTNAADYPNPASVLAPASMNFPPPPGTKRDRSTSRTRGVFNNIAAFAATRTRQGESSSPANNTDPALRQRSDSSLTRPPPGPFRSTFGQQDQSNIPPAARRSASVGVTPPCHDNVRDPLANWDPQRETSGDRSWDQGMPLPGPPPGPPPPSSRSQSMNRALDRSVNESPEPSTIHAPIPTRVARGSNLGPVPPTPADWVDEEAPPPTAPSAPPAPVASSSGLAPLRLNTQASSSTSNAAFAIQSAVEPGPGSGRDGFSQVQREPSLSIRDRRSESRARSKEPQTAVEPRNTAALWASANLEESRPANLVLASANSSGLGRRRHVAKAAASPRSAHFSPPTSSTSAAPDSRTTPLNSALLSTEPVSSRSINTPQPGTTPSKTPSFSPGPTNREGESLSRPLLANTPGNLATSASRESLHQPNTGKSFKSAISRLDDSPLSGNPHSASTPAVKFDEFAQASFERFQKFLVDEMAAGDDMERLELFAQFAVHESRLRRDRYSKAFEDMASDMLDLTRDLWRSYAGSNKRAKAIAVNTSTDAPRVASGPPSRSETGTPVAPSSGSSPGSAAFTPMTEPDSPGISITSGRGARGDGQRQGSFQPILSPIPSMAMSTIPDDSDSRGRAASRWWEASDNGSIGGGAGRKIERTKRESKYMGLPKEAREHLQWDTAEPSPSYNAAGPSNQYQSLGPNEYPPEKVGFHEDLTPSFQSGFARTPSTPQPRGLDVSRLITLPPPYPRHHPAVNNSHPELSSIRAILHSLNDTNDASNFFEQYATECPPRSDSFDDAALNDRRREMRANIQGRVAAGQMSFAEAAKEENEFEEAEAKRQQDATKQSFDIFQSKVLQPLSSIYSAKLAEATASMDSLQADLLDDAAQLNPNHTQEEGDEEPETLEKITLLKWFFEAREKLHKDAFELQNQSDEKYKHVILTPYRQAGNTAKIKEVEDFFVRDARDRRLNFSTEALKRFETFLTSVEQVVTRGVESQLSAFWDIAPGLLTVVQKVPSDERQLHEFELMIPPQEVVENPSYREYPLQYLYTLLLHAEKSAYQFIESQTNLLCLLHEVKSALMIAHCKMLEDQRTLSPTAASSVESQEGILREMQGVRQEEDRRLTRDLKERVDVVEEQWRSALGTALGLCKGRVGRFLENIGGWDEALVE